MHTQHGDKLEEIDSAGTVSGPIGVRLEEGVIGADGIK